MVRFACIVVTLAWAAPLWAQSDEPMSERERAFGSDDDEDEDESGEEVGEVPVPVAPAPLERRVPPAFEDEEDEEEKPTEPSLPTIGQDDRYANFELERGAYFSSELGLFFTLGGAAGTSNAQPFLALHAGFDINELLSAQATMMGAFVADNPPSENELSGPGQNVSSYQLINLGVELVASFRPFERLALEPRLGGGISHITPTLTDPSDPSAVLGTVNPQLTYGMDFTYLTLLTGFTAGASFTGTYVFGPGIPGFGLGIHVRYTL